MFNHRRRRSRQWASASAEIQIMEPRTLLSATVMEHNGVAYFLSETTSQVQRYNIAAESWIEPVDLTSGVGLPSAVHVDSDGIYAAFDKTVYRYQLDGSNETHLFDSPSTVDSIHSDGNLLLIYNGGGRYEGAYSLDKQTNTVIDSPEFYPSQRSSSGASISTQNNRILARSNSGSPRDISYLSYNDAGEFLTTKDSPYHGKYARASQTWTFPDGQRVVDDSGNIYSTDSLIHVGNLHPELDDVTFINDNTPLVLSANKVTVFTPSLLPAGTHTIEHEGQEIFANDSNAIVFRFDANQWMTEVFPISELNPPAPGEAVDPVGLSYTPDEVAVTNDGTLLLLSGAHQSIFRWDTHQQIYVDTFPLIGTPQHMAYSAVDDIIYLGYTDGLIRKIDLTADQPAEVPLVTLAWGPVGISVAEQYLFARSTEHSTIDSTGNIVDAEERSSYMGSNYIWSESNQKLYFLRTGFSLYSIEVNQDSETYPNLAPGEIGQTKNSPWNTRSGLTGSVHVSPNGNVVLLGSGVLHNAGTLERLTTKLDNAIHDAIWLEDTLLTIREYDENKTQIQKWEGAAFQNTDSTVWDETIHSLVPVSSNHIVAITMDNQVPQFRKLNANLELVNAPLRTLTLSANTDTVIEAAGVDSVSITVTRVGDLSEALVVELTNDTTSAVTVPSSVIIPATEQSLTFFASVHDNEIVNSAQSVQITATGRQYDSGTATVLVTDNELIIMESEGSTQVNEDGTTDTVFIALAAAPTSSVFVNVTPQTDSDVTVTPATIEFTAENWDQAQTITVAGGDDDVLDGSETESLAVTVDSDASDALFASAAAASVSVTILDDERPTPIVSVPDNERLSPSVNLTWVGIPNAVKYDLWLSRSGDDAAPFKITVSGTSRQMDSLDVGKYKFWVRGRLNSGELSPWGLGRFTVDKAVEIQLLADGQQDRSPEITWPAVPGASAYQVWANNATTGQKELINTEVAEPAYQFENLNFGNHHLWVRALGPSGFYGRWSPVARHYVGPDISPEPRATMNTKPEFVWNTMEGVEQYRIWISGPRGFRIDESGISGTTYTPDVDLTAGRYHWWVVPQTAAGQSGRWSSRGTLEIGGGAFGIAFAGESTDSSPILKWQPTEGATSYEAYIRYLGGEDADEGNNVYSGITQPEFQMTVVPDGEYQIWIRPFDSQSQPGRWSQRADLTLQTATEDIVVRPDQSTTVSTNTVLEFKWEEPEGAAGYDIFYVNFELDIEFEVHGVTGKSYTVEDQPPGQWYWVIRARTESGSAGPWEPGGIIDTTGRPFFFIAAEATSSVAHPVLEWTAVEDADRYSLFITNLETGETFFRHDHLTESHYRVESEMQPGKYRLWVKAIFDSNSLLGRWSFPVTLTVTH